MVKQKFTFFQYFRRHQPWSNISQNKVNITIFFSQILQRRPCPCKLSSRFVPSLFTTQDNGVSLTWHNAERNSEGGYSTRREYLLSVDSVVRIAPVLPTRRFSSSQMFSIMFESGDLRGQSTTFMLLAFRYAVVTLARWAGAPSCSNFSQQWNDLRIQHFVLIVNCS